MNVRVCSFIERKRAVDVGIPAECEIGVDAIGQQLALHLKERGLCVQGAPLRVEGGTGSPVNPIAVL